LFICPPKKIAVAVLTNTASERSTNELAEKTIVTLAGGKPGGVTTRKTVAVEPALLKSYAGKYALSLVFVITVTVEDGKLMAQATGQPKFEIFPESPTKFFYKVVDAQIEFEKGKDGKVNKLILHQNGQDLPGVKLP
jgi:hypothetical protein